VARLAVALAASIALLLPTIAAGGAGLTPRVVADFDRPAAGTTGAEALSRPPSVATTRQIKDGSGQALEFSGRQAPPGMAGVRITFQDPRNDRPRTVDASRYDYLTFRMRATGGASRVQVRIADTATAGNEAKDAGDITRYLPEGLSGDWRQVAVPLGALGLDKKTLAGLTLLVLDPADFTYAVDDIALKRDPEDALPPPRRRAGVP
jgi:hypothetical protein